MLILKRLFGFLFPGSLFLLLLMNQASAQVLVKGMIVDADGGRIQFAYAVNRNSGVGTVSDYDGRFTLQANPNDTLMISHLGHVTQKIFLNNWKDSIRGGVLELKCILFKNVFKMEEVVVRDHDFTKNEKDYYQRIAEAPKASGNSPISFFYDRFSHEGKVQEKMRSIYQGLLMEEIINRKVNDEVIRRITGDNKMTLDSMKKICVLSDQFLLSANEYDIFKKIKDCYINR